MRFLESVAPTWELKNEARATHTSYRIPVSNLAAGWLQFRRSMIYLVAKGPRVEMKDGVLWVLDELFQQPSYPLALKPIVSKDSPLPR